jgi:VWFA-related protein
MAVYGRRSWLFVILLAVTAVGTAPLGLAPALGQVPLSASISDVDDSEELVRSVLTVDQGGRPVADLSSESVTVVVDGRPVAVTSLEPAVDEAIPLAIILVVDTSGSMVPQLGVVQRAALDLVAQLGPADAAAVIAFASEVSTTQPLTSDRAAVEAAIDGLEAVGDTALYDGVVAAAELARDAGFQRRAVVLLTDGEDFGAVSTVARQGSLEAGAGAAAFYTIGVGPTVDAEYLDALARGTGGRFFPASTGTEIAEVYSTIEALLRSQYILEFERGEATGGEERSLAVTVEVDGISVEATTDYVSLAPAAAPAPVAQATIVSTPQVVTTPAPPAPAAIEPDADSSLIQPLLFLVASALLAIGGVLILRRRGQTEESASVVGAPPRLDARPIARRSDARPAPTTGRLALTSTEQPASRFSLRRVLHQRTSGSGHGTAA